MFVGTIHFASVLTWGPNIACPIYNSPTTPLLKYTGSIQNEKNQSPARTSHNSAL